MRWRVYPLRRRGRRLRWREAQRGPYFEGELSSCYVNVKTEQFFVASLIGERSNMQRLLPDLYEPVMVAVGDGILVLRGFDRVGEGDAAYGVVQECSCSMELIKKMQLKR